MKNQSPIQPTNQPTNQTASLKKENKRKIQGKKTFCWSESGIWSEDQKKIIPFLTNSISSTILLSQWPTAFSLEPIGSGYIKCSQASCKLCRILSRQMGVLHRQKPPPLVSSSQSQPGHIASKCLLINVFRTLFFLKYSRSVLVFCYPLSTHVFLIFDSSSMWLSLFG